MSVDATYKFGSARDSERESDRLRRQAEGFGSAEVDLLLAAGLPERGLIVDVGCGPGFFAQRLMRVRPELQVVGVDVTEAALREAARSFAALRGDARFLPVRSDVADLAYARVVLKHVPSPERAIEEMARIVKPGGVVVAQETDHSSLVLYPEIDGFGAMLHARHEIMRRAGADPQVARRLPSLFRQAGLGKIAVHILPLSTEQIGVETFANIILSGVATAIDAGLIPHQDTERFTQRVAEWTKSPDAFGWFTALLVSGVKPAAEGTPSNA